MRHGLMLTTILILLLLGAVAWCQPDIDDVITALDRLYRSDDSYAEMSMHIVTSHWERTLTMKAWSEGSDKTFISILSPPREAGMATLRIGTEMWNYLPNTNSTVRVPPSMMTGSWMGSDITNNDIVKEITYAADYTYEYTSDTTLTGMPEDGILYIRLVPKPSTAVVWSSVICAVRADDNIPLWEHYYDQHGNEIKRVTFSDIQNMGGRTIPATMEVVPTNREGQSTTITWSYTEFNQGVNSDIFTLSNLQYGGNP
jgi:outer membrane lipoprotein-sorting protein